MEFNDRLPSLRHVIVINDQYDSDDVSVKSMSSVIMRGSELKTQEQRRKIIEESLTERISSRNPISTGSNDPQGNNLIYNAVKQT
jgi:ribosome maturation protein Sdo1